MALAMGPIPPGSVSRGGRKYEGWETSMLYFSDALIMGHFGLKGTLSFDWLTFAVKLVP